MSVLMHFVNFQGSDGNSTYPKEIGNGACDVIQSDRAGHADQEAENDQHGKVVCQSGTDVQNRIKEDCNIFSIAASLTH